MGTFAGDFALPLSFRATALDGTVTTLDDAINSFDGGESATMEVSGNDPFTMGDGPNDGSVATVDFIGMLSVLLIVVAACAIVGLIAYKRRSKAKDALAKAEITIEQSIVIEDLEAQIEEQNTDGSKTYSSEIDVVTR